MQVCTYTYICVYVCMCIYMYINKYVSCNRLVCKLYSILIDKKNNGEITFISDGVFKRKDLMEK